MPSSPSFDRDALAHVARLARLHLTDAETASLSRDLARILEQFAAVQAAAPAEPAPPAPGPLRQDEVSRSAEPTVEGILSAMPERDGRLCRVPKGAPK